MNFKKKIRRTCFFVSVSTILLLSIPLMFAKLGTEILPFGDYFAYCASIITAAVAIIISVFSILLTQKNQEESIQQQKRSEMIQNEQRQKDIEIQTKPYIFFSGIDASDIGEALHSFDLSLPDTLVEDPDNIKKLLSESKTGFLSMAATLGLRFLISCDPHRDLFNIFFRKVSIVVFEGQYNEKKYKCQSHFLNISEKAKPEDSSISILESGVYQIFILLCFTHGALKKTDLFIHPGKPFEEKKLFIDEMVNPKNRIFFNIEYTSTNIHGIQVTGTMKITCKASFENGQVVFQDYENMSNWLGTLNDSERHP